MSTQRPPLRSQLGTGTVVRDGIRVLETTGEVVHTEKSDGAGMGCPGHVMSLYTPFVPLFYLKRVAASYLSNEESIRSVINVGTIGRLSGRPNYVSLMNEERLKEIVEIKVRKLLAAPGLKDVMRQSISDTRDVYRLIKKVLSEDATVVGGTSYDDSSSNNTREMTDWFSKSIVCKFVLRDGEGRIGYYSLISSTSAGYACRILAVCNRENVIYQRLHWMLTGTFDLRYMIVLVDEELENPATFGKDPIQMLYLGRLKEKLKVTAAQVFYVPLSFIEDQCFVHKFSIPKCSVQEKRGAVDSIKEMFKVFIRDSTIHMDLLVMPKRQEKLPPLVAAVKPTREVDDRLKELQNGRAVRPRPIRPTGTVDALAQGIQGVQDDAHNAMGISAEQSDGIPRTVSVDSMRELEEMLTRAETTGREPASLITHDSEALVDGVTEQPALVDSIPDSAAWVIMNQDGNTRAGHG